MLAFKTLLLVVQEAHAAPRETVFVGSGGSVVLETGAAVSVFFYVCCWRGGAIVFVSVS
jgi:hypothetical protein